MAHDHPARPVLGAGPVRGSVRVVPYVRGRAAHRAAYRALNLAWIERHFAVEDRDRRELDDPEGHFLAHGGQILMAEANAPGAPGGVGVFGTCALHRALGFVEVPLPVTDYARANIKMVLDLTRPARAGK